MATASPSSTSSAAAGETVQEVLDDPLAYAGKQVDVDGVVRQVISPLAFTVVADKDAPSGAGLLVVHSDKVSLNEQEAVEIKGTMKKVFDVAQVEGLLNDEVDDALSNDWDKKPYLEADKVDVVVPAATANCDPAREGDTCSTPSR